MASFGVPDNSSLNEFPGKNFAPSTGFHRRLFIMIRTVLIVLMALFTLSVAPLSHAEGEGEGDTVVWGT